MDKRKYKIHLNSNANLKLIDHVLFMGQVSASAANRLYDKLYDAVHSLDFNPEGRPRYFSSKNAVDDSVYRYKFCAKRHRIVFEILSDTVYIYDVQDCRQHQSKSLV